MLAVLLWARAAALIFRKGVVTTVRHCMRAGAEFRQSPFLASVKGYAASNYRRNEWQSSCDNAIVARTWN